MPRFALAERESLTYLPKERRRMTRLLKLLSADGTLRTEELPASEYGQLKLFGDKRRVYRFVPTDPDFPKGYLSRFSRYVLFHEGSSEPASDRRKRNGPQYKSEQLLYEIPDDMPIDEGLERIHDATGVRKQKKKSMKKLGREDKLFDL